MHEQQFPGTIKGGPGGHSGQEGWIEGGPGDLRKILELACVFRVMSGSNFR